MKKWVVCAVLCLAALLLAPTGAAAATFVFMIVLVTWILHAEGA